MYSNHVAVKIFASGHCCRHNFPFESEDLETVTELLKSTLKLPLHHRNIPSLTIKSSPVRAINEIRLLSDSSTESR